MFCDLVMDADHEVGKHADDYTLFRCGMFDDRTAEVSPERVDKIVSGLEVLAASRKPSGQQLEAFDESLPKEEG